MKKAIKYLFNFFLGKKFFQPLFELLHKISLAGMNYGGGSEFADSGELFVLRYIKSKLSKSEDSILFDVGANIGEYSTLLTETFNQSKHIIYAFEPSELTHQTLTDNTKGRTSIKTNKLGFSNTEGFLKLYTTGLNSGLASIYSRNLAHFNIEMASVEEIELTTIDIFCKKNNINHIHFLKIDVEGNELNVLKGAEKMISCSAIQYIQFEFGGTNIDSKTFFQDFFYLLSPKYQIYRVLRNGLSPITNYKETLEIFTATNYFAELK